MDSRTAEVARRQAIASANRIRETEALARTKGVDVSDDMTAIRVKVEKLQQDVQRRASA